jgi:hypothetical protein
MDIPPRLKTVLAKIGIKTKTRVIIGWWGAIDDKPTAGDQLAVDAIVSALHHCHCSIKVASIIPYQHKNATTIQWRDAKPHDYDIFVFVCGPLVIDYAPLKEMIEYFSSCKCVAVGVSILDAHDPELHKLVDTIVARDGLAPDTFDLALASPYFDHHHSQQHSKNNFQRCGVVLRGYQAEYHTESYHAQIKKIAKDVLEQLQVDMVPFDTVLLPNYGVDDILRQYDNVDFVITTRMHGTLFAIAKSVPVIAIDQIAGGRKVTAIANKIQWPFIMAGEHITAQKLQEAIKNLGQDSTRKQVEYSRALAVSLAHDALTTAVSATLKN